MAGPHLPHVHGTKVLDEPPAVVIDNEGSSSNVIGVPFPLLYQPPSLGDEATSVIAKGELLWRGFLLAEDIPRQLLCRFPRLDSGGLLGGANHVTARFGVPDSGEPIRAGVRFVDGDALVNRDDVAVQAVAAWSWFGW